MWIDIIIDCKFVSNTFQLENVTKIKVKSTLKYFFEELPHLFPIYFTFKFLGLFNNILKLYIYLYIYICSKLIIFQVYVFLFNMAISIVSNLHLKVFCKLALCVIQSFSNEIILFSHIMNLLSLDSFSVIC